MQHLLSSLKLGFWNDSKSRAGNYRNIRLTEELLESLLPEAVQVLPILFLCTPSRAHAFVPTEKLNIDTLATDTDAHTSTQS